MEEAIVKATVKATVKERNVDAMLKVDPGILQRLKETLPKTSSCVKVCSNFEPFKWDYAVVLLASIEQLKQALRDHPEHPHIANLWYKAMHEDFRLPLCYTGQFKHIHEFMPENVDASLKVTEEFLDSMSQALVKDVASFKEEAPAQLFGSLEDWKQHDCNRMMKEIDMHSTDEYEMVSNMYKKYRVCKESGSGHLDALNHVKSGGVYCTVENFMTLLKRIQVLENQVQEHAQVLEKCVALFEK